jgi:hypothetical protein
MWQKIIERRARRVRTLLEQGAFAGVQVPLRNGGTLPAEMFARVELDDLRWLVATRGTDDDLARGLAWQHLARDIELLHEVALARRSASTEQNQEPT